MSVEPSDRVYNYVIKNIMSSKWRPGERIMSENDLAEKLLVSRVSVRKAYDQLDAIGLIERKKGSGTYIADASSIHDVEMEQPILKVNDDDVLSLLKFRRHFEYGSVHMFIDRCSEQDLKDLEASIIEMKNAVDSKTFGHADFEFHSIIAEGTKNPIVIRLNAILMNILEEHQVKLNTIIGPTIGLQYHDMILDAIKMKDKELASMLMLRHIQAAIDQYEVIA